ncbi:MAG: ferritin family protein [Armatimonadota bacterium]
MTEQEEYVKALEYALKTEQDGRAMYLKAKEEAAAPLAQATFQMLADEEVKHIETIRQFHDRVAKSGEWPELAEVVPGEHADLVEGIATIFQRRAPAVIEAAAETGDDTEAYQTALKFESAARAWYAEHRDGTGDEKARAFYQFMYEEESRHYELLEETLTFLDSTEDWFAKHERPFYTAG